MDPRLTPRSAALRTATVLAAASLTLAGVVGGGALLSTARLSDARTTSPAVVGTGTLSLSATGGAETGTWTGSVSLIPGGSAYAGLTIANTGTLRMRYSVRALSTSPLAATLRLTVVVLPVHAGTCSQSALAEGSRVSALNLPFGASPAIAVIGSAAEGAQDGAREIAADGSERLCLQVSFPTGSGLGASARGTSATTTFTVTAESA